MYLCVYMILFIFFSSIVMMMCIGTFKTFVKGLLLAHGSGSFGQVLVMGTSASVLMCFACITI